MDRETVPSQTKTQWICRKSENYRSQRLLQYDGNELAMLLVMLTASKIVRKIILH